MTEIPRAILSDHLEEAMEGRRLVAAVFLTFKFEPLFFESSVLPVFFDITFSHADLLRRVQLEDALRQVRGGIAVYYDRGGLDPTKGSPRLDFDRIAVRHRT